MQRYNKSQDEVTSHQSLFQLHSLMNCLINDVVDDRDGKSYGRVDDV